MTVQNQRKLLLLAGAALSLCTALPVAAQTTSTATSMGGTGVSDIVVTATKRRENLQRIPGSISAISGAELSRMNANSLSDYINRLPGVVFNDYQPGVSEVVIRGIADTTYHEQGQTTVGYYLNEINIVEPGFPIAIPDIDTFDLDRVEVLRGPQGTLFGSSALGGLVNYVVKTADPGKLDAAVEGLLGSTHNSHGNANYGLKAMVNIPLIKDELGLRVVALQRYDAGYLDNVGLTPERYGTNNLRTRDLRASLVYEPFDGTKITYLGAYQDTDLDDQTYITDANSYIRSTGREEPQTTGVFLNSLRLDQDIDQIATLTVLGSYDRKTNYTLFTDPYGYVTGVTSGPNVAYDYAKAHADISTIEARVASKDNDAALRWLIGTSYIRTTKTYFDQMFAPGADAYIDANPDDFAYSSSVEAPNDRIYGYLTNTVNDDFGVFGEATYKPTDTLAITAGGRFYYTRAEGDVTNFAGYVDGSAVNLSGHVNTPETGFTPKATISYTPTSKLLAYITYSKGYRVGGINPNAGLLASIPTSYHSDTVDNFEGGVKSSFYDGRLKLDATAFDMEWHHIQARLYGPAPEYYSFVTNAGSARSWGLELSGTALLTPQLSLSTNATYQDAVLTSFLPYNFAPGGGYTPGTVLPGSSKWSVANTLSYNVILLPDDVTVDIAHRYLSKAPVAFGSDSTRGGFNVFDLHAGFSPRPNVKVLGSIENIFNDYGILNAPFTSQTAPAYTIIRPRTFSVKIDWSL